MFPVSIFLLSGVFNFVKLEAGGISEAFRDAPYFFNISIVGIKLCCIANANIVFPVPYE